MIKLIRNGWEAVIIPEMGMNTLGLVVDGEEILRMPDKIGELEKSPCAYGIPLLFPPNRTESGKFIYNNKKYELPVNETSFNNHIHGVLNRVEFRVLKLSKSEITASYQNQGEIFPFPFEIKVTYRLEDRGYVQKFKITNIGNQPMPVVFGLHTTFIDKKWIRVPIGYKWEQNNCHIPTGKLLQLNLMEREYRKGTSDYGAVSGFFTAKPHKIDENTVEIGNMSYSVSDNFNQWILWNNGGNQGFISIEPQCGAVNALNSGIGRLDLAPNRCEIFRTIIHKRGVFKNNW